MSLGHRHCDLGRAARVLGGLALLLIIGQSGAAAEPAASAVPLTKVVLFNSGVGFFEHNADVEGDAHVDLKFNVDDINDEFLLGLDLK